MQTRGLDASLAWVTAAFLALTIAMTWPLTAGLARDVPGDLGDALLNMWILGWGAENLPWVAAGQMSLADFWNANIFHPEPLALSFSEHLLGQVLQILPVYYLTGNLILAYNLLFISSFVLSGLGMYLLVRELLGERDRFSWPALVAGLIYAFVPSRIAQVAHIQSISSQWMPFALLGFRRFIWRDAGPVAGLGLSRASPLIGGTFALLMQNWSCGYYLIFFAPFAVLFVVHQVVAAGRVREWRVWSAFALSALVVAAGTLPFLTLYLDAQRVHGFARSIGEVTRFSADVYSYATAPEALKFWGSVLQVYPKPEGALFFGGVPWILFFIGSLSLAWFKPGPGLSPAAWVLLLIILIQLVGLTGILFTGGFVTSLGRIPIRATNPARILFGVAVATAILLAVSAAARQRVRAALASPLTLAIALTLLAIWLSLGPRPQSYGRPLQGLGLYGVLYETVPGFEGLRVPARYAMIAAVFLSIVAGYGMAAICQRVARPGAAALLVGAAFLGEAAFAPMTVNAAWGDSGIRPPARVEPAARAPAVYRQIARMSEVKVLAEFPFGDPAWELRYVYYSTVHWKRLVNGYSGGFPHGYTVRAALLGRVADDPDAAWHALSDAGTTHVIVHETALPADQSRTVQQWLTSHGARAIHRFEGDVLYELPGRAAV